MLLGLPLGCDSEGTDEDDADAGGTSPSAGEATGQVRFRFFVASTVRESGSLTDELTGSIYGGLYRSAEVTGTGPRDGAMQFGYVEVAGVDLQTEMVSAAEWTSEDLPPDTYTFLGFFDVDESSAGSGDPNPESGDPVTLPTVNSFTIEEGQVLDFEVRFDLVLG